MRLSEKCARFLTVPPGNEQPMHATMSTTNVREPTAYFSGTPGFEPAAAAAPSAWGP